ncbi:YlmC/YmxH family sporulation protein [Oceanobacillus luteolus]|uniref:YlmC/YmxH family sporulation protein n=1 Tax=Oceanobacillus luteolus TaxID=1274358 RepID=A0ABW4HQ37_9BACI|nr:YlmC/YmxH family sporulation protein [Oceanobacillus luteolus]MCM3738998.1 YlmC/YmxH family sporulation protein [Oceanobacillus luteolus]
MRFKEISGKEIIDVNQGVKLGVLGQSDLEIDEQTGQIEAFIVPSYKWFGLKKESDEVLIRWRNIKVIGEDMIVVESDSLSD